jgi:iron complex outermembrane receptor protein
MPSKWSASPARNDTSEVRNEIKTAGYGLTNLRTSYSWKQVRVDFGVENLFDKFYYLPTGGAYTGQGTTMSTNGIPGASPFPAWAARSTPGIQHQVLISV